MESDDRRWEEHCPDYEEPGREEANSFDKDLSGGGKVDSLDVSSQGSDRLNRKSSGCCIAAIVGGSGVVGAGVGVYQAVQYIIS
jgi:hypothetical protein